MERVTLNPARWGAPRIPSLDGVRGVAILAVMVFHGALCLRIDVARDPLERVYLQIARAGWAGVDLFFVLSGFLITGLLWDLRPKRSRYFRFYTRRALRILPLYYAALILLSVGFVAARRLWALDDLVWYFFHLQNWIVAINAQWPDFAFSHFWSLAIEEQFYLLWPIIVFSCGLRGLKGVCIGILVLSVPLRIFALHHGISPLSVHVCTLTRLDGLAIGSFIALQNRQNGPQKMSRSDLALLIIAGIALAVIGVAAGSFDAGTRLMQTVGLSTLALFFGALLKISIAIDGGFPATLFRSRALGLIGRLSYGLYVFHVPLIRVLATRWNGNWVVFGTHAANRVAFLLLSFAISFVLAFLSYHLYEKHFLRLADVLAPRARRALPLRPMGAEEPVSSDKGHAVATHLDADSLTGLR